MQPLESQPLWVWLTLGLMTAGGIMYLTGYMLIADILAYLG